MKIETGLLPTGNQFTDQYIQSFDTLGHLFHWNPEETASFTGRARQLASRFDTSTRKCLVDELVTYQRIVGASETAIQSAERLLDERAVAVVTGQQAGLLTGPLYTIHKALTVILQAKRIEREIQVPCVPVFWVAAEDHDFAEVNHCYVVSTTGEPTRIALHFRPNDRLMVGAIQVPRHAVDQVIEQLLETTEPTDYRDDLVRLVTEAWETTDNMADWCVAIMARLFAETPLVFVNATRVACRKQVAEVFVRAVRDNVTLRKAAQAGHDAVVAAGFSPQVEVSPSGSMLFYVDEQGRRLPIDAEEGKLSVRGVAGESLDENQLAALAESSPQSFSSGVLLRPIVQDFLLPTLAYVGGPAEIAYHGMQRGLFEAFGITMPILLSRFNLTLVDAVARRTMEKFSLTPWACFAKPSPLSAYLDSVDPVGIQKRFDDLQSTLSHLYDDVVGWLDEVHEQLPSIGEQSRRSVLHRVERLRLKTEQLHRLRHDVFVRQLSRLQGILYPDGSLQERVVSAVSFVSRYGPQIVRDLARLDLGEHTKHRVIYLD